MTDEAFRRDALKALLTINVALFVIEFCVIGAWVRYVLLPPWK